MNSAIANTFLFWWKGMFKVKFSSSSFLFCFKFRNTLICSFLWRGTGRVAYGSITTEPGQRLQAFVWSSSKRYRCLTCISCYPISYCSDHAQKFIDCGWRQPVHWAHCWLLALQSTGYDDDLDLWIQNNCVKYIHWLEEKARQKCTTLPLHYPTC